MLYRLFLLLMLCVSFPSMAQVPDQSAEDTFMFEKIEEANKSFLTQNDVDVFVKVYKTSKSLKENDRKKWQAIEDASLGEKEKMINEIAQLKPGESFFVSAFRITLADRASDPKTVAEAQQEYTKMTSQLSEIEKQLATMPKEQAQAMRNQLNTAIEMMRRVAEFPAENLKIYTANKAILTEAKEYFDSK